MASSANANSVSFSQSTGSSLELAFIQSNSTSHVINGLDSLGASDPSKPFSASGNFSKISIVQSSTYATDYAGRVVVDTGLSILDHVLGGTAGISAILDVNVKDLNSVLDVSGSGEKSISIEADNSTISISHDISLLGKALEFNLNHVETSDITATITALGDGATFNANLSGSNSVAAITAQLNANSRLDFNQSGGNSIFTGEIDIASGAFLTINHSSESSSIEKTGISKITVAANETVVLNY